MATLACSDAGEALQQRAARQLARDWPLLRQHIALQIDVDESDDADFTAQDARLAAGFGWAQRPLEVSLPVLQRLVAVASQPLPLLEAAIASPDALSALARQAGLSGRKAPIAALRQQTATALETLLGVDADALRQSLK